MNVMTFNNGDTFPNIIPNWCEKHKLEYFGCRCVLCLVERMDEATENTKNSTLRFGECD